MKLTFGSEFIEVNASPGMWCAFALAGILAACVLVAWLCARAR